MIYITKSANSLDFLRQNLEILSGKEGERFKTDYRQRWIEPSMLQALPKKGEIACIVFGDPPWDLYVPIRFITFSEDVYLDGEKYIFSFRLENRVEALDASAFTSGMRSISNNQYFVFRNKQLDLAPLRPNEKEAWRHSIRHIVGFEDGGSRKANSHQLERYLSSLFLRLDGTYVDQDVPVDLVDTEIRIDHQYTIVLDCYAPHLLEETISQMEIVGKSDPPVLGVKSIFASRDAHLSLKMSPVYSGKTLLKIWVQPEQTRSSQIALNCEVAGSDQFIPAIVEASLSLSTQLPEPVLLENAPGSHPGLEQVEVQTLYNHLQDLFTKQGPIKPELKRDLAIILETLPMDEDSRRFLQEEQGIFACQQGRFEDAYRILNLLGIERIRSQDAVASFFISAWKTNKNPNIGYLVDRFEPTLNPELTVQIKDGLPWRGIISQKELLESLYLSGLFTIEILKKIAKIESDGESLLKWVDYAVNESILEKDAAFHLMEEWMGTSSNKTLISRERVARRMLEYGIEIQENVEYLVYSFGSQILPEREIDRAQQLVQKSIALDSPKRVRLYEALADLFVDFNSPDWRRLTGDLFMEAGRYYLKHPDQSQSNIHLAGGYLEKARTAYGEAKKTDLKKLEEEWKELAEATPVIKVYLTQLDEHKHDRLREIINGKKVAFVGGSGKDFDADGTARQLGFVSGEHVEVYRDKGDNGLASLIQKIKKGKVNYIIHIIAFTAHHPELKKACDDSVANGNEVHYVPYNSGSFQYSAFLNRLFEFHKTELQNE